MNEAIGDNVLPGATTFHWRNGWQFARGEADNVHIWNIERGIDLCIPPNEWDSIVASVNAKDVIAGREVLARAKAAHQQQGTEP